MHLWLVTDRKPGHVAQLEGLHAGLAARTDVQPRWIEVGDAVRAATAAPPDLIACAGRLTQRPALSLQRRFGGRSVVLMRPSPLGGRFDLAVVPEHDDPKPGPDVVLTRGALNPVRPMDGDPGRGLILIGGPSRHVAWNDAAVLHQIDQLLKGYQDFFE